MYNNNLTNTSITKTHYKYVTPYMQLGVVYKIVIKSFRLVQIQS